MNALSLVNVIPQPGSPYETRSRHAEATAWSIHARSITGKVRPRNEDAWALLERTEFLDEEVLALAVFDGMGGIPGGHEASHAAAAGLDTALRAAAKPADVLPLLNEKVRAGDGCTTAVVCTFPLDGSDQGVVLSVGDSSAYILDEDGQAVRITPRDASSKTTLTDFLGHERMEGHVLEARVPPGSSLLLCTDGVDGVLPMEALTAMLSAAPERLARALETLLRDVEARGAPDNATILVAHHKR